MAVNQNKRKETEMERLTVMHDGMMVPRKACTFDREEVADDCKECTEICEDEGGVCRTCILQECLTRLGKYEDTGLTPEQIRELKERDMPKKIELNAGVPICPVCGRKVVKCYNFCPDCGQRILR